MGSLSLTSEQETCSELSSWSPVWHTPPLKLSLRLLPRLTLTTDMDTLDLDMLVLDMPVLDTPGWDTLVLDTPGLDTLAWDIMAVDTTLVRGKTTDYLTWS